MKRNIQHLPVATDVENAVMKRVRKRCANEVKWLLPLAAAVVELPSTRLEIRRIWQQLIEGLSTVMTVLANSSRASRLTKIRLASRHQEKMAFVTQPVVEAAASGVFGSSGGDDPTSRVKRALLGLYHLIEQVSVMGFCSFRPLMRDLSS